MQDNGNLLARIGGPLFKATGGWNRKLPIGGFAKGIERNWRTPGAVLSTNPVTRPLDVPMVKGAARGATAA